MADLVGNPEDWFSHVAALIWSNALVICNHGSPRPRGGWGIAVEMSGALTKVLPRQ